MAERKIKLTGPRRFHLTDSKKHQPIANLSGDGDAKAIVNLDRAKLWDKVAAEFGPDQLDERMHAAQPGQPSQLEKMVRQYLGPNASPEQVQDALQNLHKDPAAERAAYLQATGNQPLLDAAANTGGHEGSTVAGGFGNVSGGAAESIAGLLSRGPGWLRALGQGVAYAGGQHMGARPDKDQSLTGTQLQAADQFNTGSTGEVLDRVAKEKLDAENGVPGAAERLKALSPEMQASLKPGASVEARAQQHLDPIRSQQAVGAFNSATGATSLASAGRAMPGIGLAASLGTELLHPERSAQDPVAADTRMGAAGGAYAAGRIVADDMANGAATMKPPAAATTISGKIGRGLAAPFRAMGSPEVRPALKMPRMPWQKAVPTVAEGVEAAAPAASRSVGQIAGTVAKRLGIAGLGVGAANTLGQGIRRTYSDEGQKEYEDMVRAQTEANGNRSALGVVGDTAKAIGSAALGDGDHLSTVMASGMAGQGYRDTVHQDAEASDVAARAKNEHYTAFQQMFPNVDPQTINAWADKATERSVADYRLSKINNKPFPVGTSSFEKRLYDKQDPTYAHLTDQQRETYKDLGRRLGGTVGEGFVNDPEVSQALATAPAVKPYESQHVSYTPAATDVAGNQAASAQVRQQQIASGVAKPAAPAGAPPAPKPPAAAKAAPMAPVPEAKPSPGTAPIGQPFSPARGT